MFFNRDSRLKTFVFEPGKDTPTAIENREDTSVRSEQDFGTEWIEELWLHTRVVSSVLTTAIAASVLNCPELP
jgi:hypothetical protein